VSLKAYFKKAKGLGVLSTADKWGRVDSAVYAKPATLGDGTVAFLMADKLTHSNLEDNPYAAYLFKEDGKGYKGKRLYLKKVKESGGKNKNFLVAFKVLKDLPLVGTGKKVSHACPTCHQKVGEAGHLCSPGDKHESCDWCGALIPDARHLCNKKIKELAYICNSCGRTAVQADFLCEPKKVK
jgi:hypothetical protein